MTDEEEGPRPLPKVALLSELQGKLRPARELAPRPREERGRDRPKAKPFGESAGLAARPKAPAKPSPGGRKAARKPTAERLWNITLYNLGQRETSSAGLRRLLSNRVLRYVVRLEGEERAAAEAEGQELVAAAVERAVKERLVDDARFAEMKARSWRAKGWGERRIAMEMRRQGMDADTAQDALGAVDEDAIDGIDDPTLRTQEADLAAADTLCKRRRIGPYRRTQPVDAADRARVFRREMGVLARAGFSGDMIKTTLGRPPEEDEI